MTSPLLVLRSDNTLIDNDHVQAILKSTSGTGSPLATGTRKSLAMRNELDTSITWVRWSAFASKRCIAQTCCACRAG